MGNWRGRGAGPGAFAGAPVCSSGETEARAAPSEAPGRVGRLARAAPPPPPHLAPKGLGEVPKGGALGVWGPPSATPPPLPPRRGRRGDSGLGCGGGDPPANTGRVPPTNFRARTFGGAEPVRGAPKVHPGIWGRPRGDRGACTPARSGLESQSLGRLQRGTRGPGLGACSTLFGLDLRGPSGGASGLGGPRQAPPGAGGPN